ATDDLRWSWQVTDEGLPVSAGELDVPAIPAGASTLVGYPAAAPSESSGECWLTVRAELRSATGWAEAGHELGWAQHRLSAPTQPPAPVAGAVPVRRPELADFDPLTGRLLRLGDLALLGPRLDLWRAPTDNDRGEHGEPLEPVWRALGLHRMRHRTVAIEVEAQAITVRSRVAPASIDAGFAVCYRWTALPEAGLRLAVEVVPDGDWPVPLPRLGLLLRLPAAISTLEWFGCGPGEAYADSHAAVRIGRYRLGIDELQTPYAYPQENGNRRGVRWARLTDEHGDGLLVTAEPTIELTARRWTSNDLDAARHPTDLRPRDAVYLNLDFAQTGLGTASCGPGVLPEHQLLARPVSFAVCLVPVAG
ncbi:MAG: beta-galactosidase domain 4-containing protein, partial [Jatrophihabitantaceae bacterium]